MQSCKSRFSSLNHLFMNKFLSIFFLSALLLSSCSKSSDTSSSNTTTPTAGNQQIIANIAGTDMTFQASAREALSGVDSLSIFGYDTVAGKNYKITLTMLNITKAGTYDITTLALPTTAATIRVQLTSANADGSNSMTYDSEQSLNKKVGSLTYTSLTFLVQGTFNATLPQVTTLCSGGAPITIINGSFKITFA